MPLFGERGGHLPAGRGKREKGRKKKSKRKGFLPVEVIVPEGGEEKRKRWVRTPLCFRGEPTQRRGLLGIGKKGKKTRKGRPSLVQTLLDNAARRRPGRAW